MLLNEHPHILLGVRRFTELRSTVDRFLLAPEHLVSPLSFETRIRGQLLYSRLRERLAAGQLRLAGDIAPEHVHALPSIHEFLGDLRVVVVIGEPQQAGVEDWRACLRLVRETERTESAGRVFVLDSDAFAAGETAWLTALLTFLGLPMTDRIEAEYERLIAVTDTAPAAGNRDPSDAELSAWLAARCDAELERYARARPELEPRKDGVLDAEHLAARARERAQIESQWVEGSDWPDDRRALTLAYAAQARETVVRARLIRRLHLTAAPGLPAPGLRVNIIAPAAPPDQIGRKDAYEQLARSLGPLCAVRLVCSAPPESWLSEVEVRVETSAGVAHDDCDVVIYPSGGLDVESLPRAVRPILWLDGFEPHPSPVILASLDSACEVLAASSSLCRLAHERGVRAIHFPTGLDRRLSVPGAANRQRRTLVTGVAQAPDHMGCEELSEAMVRIREARHEVEVTLMGGVPADGATQWVLHPRIGAIGHFLRQSAVHVSSAREGFSLLSAAALASGAALVTSDVDGSSDFAIQDRTAIVVPGGGPDALASHVLSLLDDVERRTRLAAEGARQVRALMPPWREAARALALMLVAAER